MARAALQVRPQFHAVDGVVRLLEALSKTRDLRGFRLKTIYRPLMAIDEIVKLDTRNDDGLLTDEQRRKTRTVLDRIKAHPRCADDDTSDFAVRNAAKILTAA